MRGTVHADTSRFARTQGPLLLDKLLQRAAADELHPDPDRAVARFGSVNGDDVRMAMRASRRPSLTTRVGSLSEADGSCDGARRPEQLQRHFAVEVRVPRAKHFTEGPAADRFQQLQVSPAMSLSERRRASGADSRRAGVRVRLPMKRRNVSDDVQLPDDASLARARRSSRAASSRPACRRGSPRPGSRASSLYPRAISSASFTSARRAALRAASGDARPVASASCS